MERRLAKAMLDELGRYDMCRRLCVVRDEKHVGIERAARNTHLIYTSSPGSSNTPPSTVVRLLYVHYHPAW